MSPDTFAALLDRATGTPPPSPPPSDALRAGRTRLRHRRLGAAVTVCAMVLAVGGAATALPDRDSAHDVASAWTDVSVLHRCLAGDQNGPGEDALRASGTPVVEAWVRTDLKISAAISSADGTMWAECWIWLMPQASGETSAGMSFYDATQRSAGRAGGWHVGTGCGVPETQERGCAYWALSTVDKLPPEVAAVRYELGDGTSVTLPTTNGFAVLNVRHPLPAVGRVDRDGVVKGFDWGRQITYLDADGAVLAAARLDNPRNPDVPGVPPLRDYRSLGRSWVP